MNNDSPVVERDPVAEAAHLAGLAAEVYPRILVASDLHLGAGANPVTGVFAREENFLADRAFGRFLSYFAAGAEGRQLFVLNGDTFDFPRISLPPETSSEFRDWSGFLARLGQCVHPDALRASVGRTERKFGLRTHDYKSVWNLLMIARGHPGFFGALADWLGAGHALVINTGNHDVQLHWPLVRRAIRTLIVDAGSAAASATDSVAFCDQSFWLGNLYFEHGHRFEPMTRVDGNPVLDKDPTQLRLPLGSFINRYMINRVERIDPFIDNVKPVGKALVAIFRRHPLRTLTMYFQGWRFIGRAVRMQKVLNAAVLMVFLGLTVPVLGVALLVATVLFPELSEELLGWIPLLQHRIGRLLGGVGGVLLPIVLPYLLGLASEVARGLGIRKRHRPMHEAAREILAGVPADEAPRYAIFGHTHRPTVAVISERSGPDLYANTGTWVAVWSRARPDLHGQVRYTFLDFTRGTDERYRHALCIWDDHAGEARESNTLAEVGD